MLSTTAPPASSESDQVRTKEVTLESGVNEIGGDRSPEKSGTVPAGRGSPRGSEAGTVPRGLRKVGPIEAWDTPPPRDDH